MNEITEATKIEELDRLWTEKDVKQFAGFKSRATLYKAIGKGLPVIRFGEGNCLLRFNPITTKRWFAGQEGKHA
jgi:hypothetical protein